MAKRFIGIDCGEKELRLAVAVTEKGEIVLRRTLRFGLEEGAALGDFWQQALGSEPAYGDRAAAALPSGRAFSRRLDLPFTDADKIEAVLINELQTRLPLVSGKLAADFLLPREKEEGVPAIASEAEEVSKFLQPFDDADIPLYCLDVAPFAYAAALPESCGDGLLVTAHRGELTVALIVDERVVDYRLLPMSSTDENQRYGFVIAQGLGLERACGYEEMPFFLVGEGIDKDLQERLREAHRQVLVPHLEADGLPVPAEMLPAALLARRAALRDRQNGFNLRRGSLARKSEWATVKSRLIQAGSLLAAIIVITATSLSLNYMGKARRADALKQSVVEIYSKTFPGKRVLEHQVAMQMKNEYQSLEKKARLLGIERTGSALEALREISKSSDPEIDYRLSDISYSSESLRLEGKAPSFDAVNNLGRELERSTLFSEVKIADAKMTADGSEVGFRLNLPLAAGGAP